MDADKFEKALNYKPISAFIGRYRRLKGLTTWPDLYVYVFQWDSRQNIYQFMDFLDFNPISSVCICGKNNFFALIKDELYNKGPFPMNVVGEGVLDLKNH